MDILSPTYSPAEGVTRTPAPTTILAGVDAAIDADWGVEDDDPTATLRAGIADAERALHDLSMTLLSDDIEARIGAMYALTDLAEQLTGLRLSIEVSL